VLDGGMTLPLVSTTPMPAAACGVLFNASSSRTSLLQLLN
jgi:hypothetical protein